ncbi:MAG: DUF4271 domain-containing protein [Sphingobacterium sp.]|jgi:hypothetical protein|uniref:DUF4271 domain-containing protein n=1 Tax=unclassified Sphingobacterium TaxID=2609468 RepID=UPI0028438826|nr:DUF4271 domain-containing protein [Sphingobacterium sp.]MDR3009954.1 DUF4271 domain-containing protein [Sphingobacterium sp.]
MSVTIFKYHILFVLFLLFSISGLKAQRRAQRAVIQSSTVAADSLNAVKDSVISPSQKVLESLNPALQNQYRIVTVEEKGLMVHNIDNFDVRQYFQGELRYSNLDRQYGTLKVHRENWILFTVLALILGVGMIRVFFPSDIKLVFQGYWDDRVLLSVSKEDTILTSWPFIFLFILFSGAIGLFVSLFYAYELNRFDFITFPNYMKTVGMVGGLFALKIGFIRFLSFVFEIRKLVKEYVTVLYLIYFNTLFLMLPVLLILSLVPLTSVGVVLHLAIVGAGLLFFYRFLKTAAHIMSMYKFSISYLILYLCCLEIAPILILLRLLS